MQPPFDRLPQERSFTLSGLDLHLLEWDGDGPPLLMLHGWLDQAWTFGWLAQHLPQRLLAWDARGYGRSGRAAPQDFYHFFDYLWDLHQLLDQLGLEKVRLLGHSMGGMVASFYAAVYPERVAGLINLEGWIVPDSPVEKTPERVRLWIEQRSRRGALKPLTPELALERMQSQDPLLSPQQAAWLAHTATRPEASPQAPESEELFWRYDPRHRMRSPQPFRLDQAQAFWNALQCPVLLIYGKQSEALKLPDWEARLSAFAHADIVEIPDAGHNLHLHQPQAIATQIRAWLAQYA